MMMMMNIYCLLSMNTNIPLVLLALFDSDATALYSMLSI